MPPSACSKRPRRIALRAGERAALVAEQLGLEQVLRNRRGVDRDERPRRARAVPVQRARDELLAGARFAGDEHRRARLRQAADRAKHLLHRRRLAEDLGRVRDVGGRRRRVPRLVERAPNQRHRVVDVERLRQVFERAALERGDRAVEVRVRGHDDDRHLRMALLHLVRAARAPIRPACGCRTPAPAARRARAPAAPRTPKRTSCTAMPSRASAFSSTQRIERSSSTIQTASCRTLGVAWRFADRIHARASAARAIARAAAAW